MNDLKRIADALESIAENVQKGMDEGFPTTMADLDFNLLKKIEDLVTEFNLIGSVAHPINVRVE